MCPATFNPLEQILLRQHVETLKHGQRKTTTIILLYHFFLPFLFFFFLSAIKLTVTHVSVYCVMIYFAVSKQPFQTQLFLFLQWSILFEFVCLKQSSFFMTSLDLWQRHNCRHWLQMASNKRNIHKCSFRNFLCIYNCSQGMHHNKSTVTTLHTSTV